MSYRTSGGGRQAPLRGPWAVQAIRRVRHASVFTCWLPLLLLLRHDEESSSNSSSGSGSAARGGKAARSGRAARSSSSRETKHEALFKPCELSAAAVAATAAQVSSITVQIYVQTMNSSQVDSKQRNTTIQCTNLPTTDASQAIHASATIQQCTQVQM